MKNQYGIPEEELDEIFRRDMDCVYCHKKMVKVGNPKYSTDRATIEHLNHLPDWDSVRSFVSEGKSIKSIIAICCASCNSSRSDKKISDWFNTQYCIERNINFNTVAEPVRKYIKKYEK